MTPVSHTSEGPKVSDTMDMVSGVQQDRIEDVMGTPVSHTSVGPKVLDTIDMDSEGEETTVQMNPGESGPMDIEIGVCPGSDLEGSLDDVVMKSKEGVETRSKGQKGRGSSG